MVTRLGIAEGEVDGLTERLETVTFAEAGTGGNLERIELELGNAGRGEDGHPARRRARDDDARSGGEPCARLD